MQGSTLDMIALSLKFSICKYEVTLGLHITVRIILLNRYHSAVLFKLDNYSVDILPFNKKVFIE